VRVIIKIGKGFALLVGTQQQACLSFSTRWKQMKFTISKRLEGLAQQPTQGNSFLVEVQLHS
jgi:hypothetical protein